MKIYSDWALAEHPKARKITDWILTEEKCNEDTYLRFRVPQSQKPDNWFRNMKLVQKEEVIEERYGNRPYYIYHVAYEREHEYYVVDIDDNFDALLELLKPLDSSYGLINKNNELWIEMLGE